MFKKILSILLIIGICLIGIVHAIDYKYQYNPFQRDGDSSGLDLVVDDGSLDSPHGVTGSIQFYASSSAFGGNADFTFTTSTGIVYLNGSLGVVTTTPSYPLSVSGTAFIHNSSATSSALIVGKGRVGIGTNAPSSLLNLYAVGTTDVTIQSELIARFIFATAGSGTGGSTFFSRKSRGTIASPTAIQSGDTIFNIIGQAHGQGSFDRSAEISFISTETDGFGSEIIFRTVNNGEFGRKERISIKQTETIINDFGEDKDFRVESENKDKVLFVEASGDGAVRIQEDNVSLTIGEGNDGSISYDTTNLILDPDAVGTGYVSIGVTGDDDIKFNHATSTSILTTHVSTTSFSAGIETVSGDTTLDVTYYTVLVDASGANRTITLPLAASSLGRIYHIKKIDSSGNTVTIDANGAELIEFATTVVLTVQGESVTIQSNSSAWYIL